MESAGERRLMKKILFNSLMIILLLAAVFILPIFYPAGMAVYLRLLLLLLILAASFQLFKTLCIDRQVSPITANTATVFFSLFVIFILLEAVFMFLPRSHSADYTLASKLWYAKYWKPINSLGFRDQEPDNKHPVILFVGDSFTAGHGLKSVRERFSNIVGEELNKKPQQYTIVNIGWPNLDPRGEYETMMNFLYLTRIKPQTIVLQYCCNDIEGAAARNGMIFDGFRPPENLNKFLLLIGSGSYVFNYLYFLFPREYLGMSYINYLTGAYKNDKVMAQHKEDLMLFVDYARKNSIPLVVVVFPFLADIPMSQSLYVSDIAAFFKTHQVGIINIAELAEKIPVEDRVVNKNDTHASIKLNKMIAREILNRLN
jgi:hypothetical protein